MKLKELIENPDNPSIATDVEMNAPKDIIEMLGLHKASFSKMCKEGLFCYV